MTGLRGIYLRLVFMSFSALIFAVVRLDPFALLEVRVKMTDSRAPALSAASAAFGSLTVSVRGWLTLADLVAAIWNVFGFGRLRFLPATGLCFRTAVTFPLRMTVAAWLQRALSLSTPFGGLFRCFLATATSVAAKTRPP